MSEVAPARPRRGEEAGPPGWLRGAQRLATAPGAGMGLVLVVFMVLVGVFQPSFLTPQNLSVLMQQASGLIIASYGMAFVILSANIDLSTGSLAAVSGVTAVLVATHTGSVATGMFAGIAVGSLMGAINGFLVAYVKIPSFIATFGTLTYGAGVALAISHGRPIYSPPAGFSWLGQAHVGPVPVSFLMAVTLLFLCQFILVRTSLGRKIRMVGDNSRAANLSGVNVQFIRFIVFTMAGALAAFAALILSSRVNSGQPNLAPLLQFKAIAAVAVGGVALTGGRGHMQQVFVGALILGVLENALNVLGVSSYWQEVAVGAVIVLAIVLGQRNLMRDSMALVRKRLARGGGDAPNNVGGSV